MCDPCCADGAEIAAARSLLDSLLRTPLTKAWGFDRAVVRLGTLLRDVAAPAERAATAAARAALEADWGGLSPAERTRRVRAAVAAAREALREVPRRAASILGRAGVETVTTARRR